MRSDRSSNDDERVPDPRSSHRRPDNPGTFRAPPSLNVGEDFLGHPEPDQRRGQGQTDRPGGGPLHHRARSHRTGSGHRHR